MGYWLFGLMGAALGMPLGALVNAMFCLFRVEAPALAAPLPLLLASAALYDVQDASTLAWGQDDAPNGTQYKASSLGLAHVLNLRQTVSPTRQCRWYLTGGQGKYCAMAPGAGLAYSQLLAVFPQLRAAIAACLAGALLQGWLGWRHGATRRAFSLAAALAALAAFLFATSLGSALEEFAQLQVGVGGPLGTMEVAAAILLCLASALAMTPRGASCAP
jgi:hypothetical protein